MPRPAPVPLGALGKELWSVEPVPGAEVVAYRPAGDVDVLRMASRAGDGKLRETLVVDAATGKTRFSLRLPADKGRLYSICAGRDESELLAATKTHIFAIDAATGEITRTTPLAAALDSLSVHRGRRASLWRPPFPAGNDRFILSVAGRWMCIGNTGTLAWKQSFPGGMGGAQPAVMGDLLVTQASGRSGKGRVEALDLSTGDVRWRGQTGSSGKGVLPLEDGSGFLTTGYHYTGTVFEGSVSRHSVQDGRELWACRRPGPPPAQLPLIDPSTGRAYVWFGDGTIVCLAVETGAVAWETRMGRMPLPLRNAPARGRTGAMSLGKGILLATDRTAMLTVLALDTGNGSLTDLP